jgi:hypothetical protein
MTVQTLGYGPPQVVEALPRQPMPFGLFSVLSLRPDSESSRWANGIEWETASCDPVTAFDWQDDPDCDTEFEKFFRGPGAVGTGRPFTVVGSYKCGTPGGQAFQRGEEFATADLLATEERQAEMFVWRRLAAAAADVNPGGALGPAAALAALEDWLGDAYGSLGVIHGPRGLVSMLDTLVNASGSRLLTKVGTPVAAGAGYPGSAPGGAPAAAGETWVLASPALFGYRGEVQTHAALDRQKNDHYALAERQYVVGFDPCGVGAVRMTLA